jgi:hypothetical protein
MARGVALSAMVTALRHETGRSVVAQSNDDEEAMLKQHLRRVQEFYYDDYDWPHLNVIRKITLAVNQRMYPFPTTMNLENAFTVWVYDNGKYRAMPRDIGMAQYNTWDSLLGAAAETTFSVTAGTETAGVNMITSLLINSVEVINTNVDWTGTDTITAAAIATEINATTTTPNYYASSDGAVVTVSALVTAGTTHNTFVLAETVAGDMTISTPAAMAGGVDAEQSSPPSRWEVREDDETDAEAIEVWPVPDTADVLYITGKRNLADLLVDADTCDIDDQLIILTCAAEMLARSNKKDGQAKAQAAQARYFQMKRRSKSGKPAFQLRGMAPDVARPTGIEITG